MSEQKPSKPVLVPHGSVLLTDLPADIQTIYTGVIRSLANASPRVRHRSGRPFPFFISEASVIEESGNATLVVEVPSKEAAQRLCRQLQNARVCGRRWKAQYAPARQVHASPDPCLVECVLVPEGSRDLAERALAAVPGFLGLSEPPPELVAQGFSGTAVDTQESGESEGKLLASFADEGCALHARAVLSGRLIGTSGIRMFLARRQ